LRILRKSLAEVLSTNGASFARIEEETNAEL